MELDEYINEPYDCNDPTNEPRPDSVIYTHIFADLRSANAKAAQLLRDPLSHSKFQNVITGGLLRHLARRTKANFPDQILFAIAGDMKAGKSSVINSILGLGTIARKGDGGGSCTWVVQRYMKSFDEQNSPFAAKVSFFSKDEIRDILRSLLIKYHRASGKHDKQKYDSLDDDDEEEDVFAEQESRVESFGDQRDAVTAFMAMFCEQEEFQTVARAHAFLKQAKTEDDPSLLNLMTMWAQDTVNLALDGNPALLLEAPTPEELLWALQPYTYQVGGLDGDGMSAPWPLVSVVDFGLDHPLLNEGIVFVDSPGLSDANASRTANAQRHHRKCTHKIAVADIGRAEDDANLRANLEMGYRTRGSGNVILVLTHADSIDLETEVTGTPTEKKRLAKLTEDLKALQVQKQKRAMERSRVPLEDRDDVEEVIRSIVANIRKLQNEKNARRLEMRNRKVVKSMQDIYRQLTGDPRPLATFAVGNKVYQQYQSGFTAEDKPEISVKQTNIPALRYQLYKMPVDGRYNDTMHLAQVQLPSLVTSFELYCTRMHVARKSEIEAMIQEPKKLLPDLVAKAMSRLKLDVDSKILVSMKSEEADWVKEARLICRRWALEYYSNHLAILKNDGVRRATRKFPQGVDWDDELLDIKRADLETWFADLQGGLTYWCIQLGREIGSDNQANVMALGAFLKSFQHGKDSVHRVMNAWRMELAKEISNIMEKSFLAHADNFLSPSTLKIYAEVREIKGRGAPKIRLDTLERRIATMGSVWSKMHDAIEKAFDDAFARSGVKLIAAVGETFDVIHDNFNLLCDDTRAKSEEDKAMEEILREKLAVNLGEVKEMLGSGGEIARLVEECKAYHADCNKGFAAMLVP